MLLFVVMLMLVNLKLQQEEVSNAKYFSKEDLLDRINNNYYELTEKNVSWGILNKILESNILEQLIIR